MNKQTPSEALAELRVQVDKADRDLLAVASHRIELVKRIAAVKASAGVSLYDRNRESLVLENAGKAGKDLGISQELSRALIATIIEHGHTIQEEILGSRDASSPLHSILIIGGRGRMGKRFHETFSKMGLSVSLLEKGESISDNALQEFGVVMLAVPMSEAVSLAKHYAPKLSPHTLLVDINSLKEEICSVMEMATSGEVLGLHPMCGPTVKSFRRQKMVVCSIRSGEKAEWFKKILGRIGFDLVETTPRIHDQMMARVQVLTHLSKLALGDAWQRGGLAVDETLKFVSPIYLIELAVMGRLFAQDPELYAEIEMTNPWAEKVRSDLQSSLAQLSDILARKDKKAFVERFESIREYLKSFSEDALRLSDKIVDRLVLEPIS